MPDVRDHGFDELTVHELHDILRLRIDVFVVEQECAYPELDGRDRDPTTRHVWIADDEGVAAYLRILDEDGHRRMGRIVTRASARGSGLGGRLVDHALTTSTGPWVLDAQIRLEGWYVARGFVTTGPQFVEDGIPHVPMRREV